MNNPLPILLLAALGFVYTPDAGATVAPVLTLTEVNSTTLDWSWDTTGGGTHGVLTSAGDSWGVPNGVGISGTYISES